ncbi:MAG: tetratricopeptide repeat protein, partial [Thermoleophilia bacterium]|nr:tetratricopeptide repeat protein [Thermoleophilia bacterium]
SLQAGNKAVAVQQFRLARESLEAAIERDRARQLLLDRTGAEPSRIQALLQNRAERVTALYRIGRGLLNAGEPQEALPLLEQAFSSAQTDSPGRMVEQSLALTLALAKAQTMPEQPKTTSRSFFSFSYFAMDADYASYIKALTGIRTLVFKGLAFNKSAAAYIQGARTLLLIGDDREAVSYLRSAISLDPRAVDAYLLLGSHLESLGMLIQARELYSQGLQQVPDSVQLATAYALATYHMLPVDQSLPRLQEAVKMGGRDPYLFASLGDCYRKLGWVNQARAAYKAGLVFNPKAKPLVDRLATLPPASRALP